MSETSILFALNHMACPTLSPIELIGAAKELGMGAVELRNDVKENSVIELETARAVKVAADDAGISVLSINALYPFNVWNEERRSQAEEMAEVAAAAGARGLVCCPLVDAEDNRTAAQRATDLRIALKDLKDILEKHSLHGYVEALGFPISTLRFKKEAIEAINDVGGNDVFGLVHDTFHHVGANDPDIYPQATGLVHVSAVIDKEIAFADMLDGHREFVGAGDRLNSISQVKSLIDGGYTGYISFEPFYAGLWDLQDPVSEIRKSMEYMAKTLEG
ncbi:TIM barrel protein [Paraglaciecola chathamensis]|uniref:Inosose isomerase n=1 Tax=Paraglaciecola chathamensis S18K6 TaxID=1127672 RepID=A0AAV3UY00_9ALTE|nr:TIM barrel protein [Paraglaciecola chathamensis]GAC12549.1 inosose isomerase [Paraglaciecola chathamensis S18K6]